MRKAEAFHLLHFRGTTFRLSALDSLHETGILDTHAQARCVETHAHVTETWKQAQRPHGMKACVRSRRKSAVTYMFKHAMIMNKH
jgi:hypothetical protein